MNYQLLYKIINLIFATTNSSESQENTLLQNKEKRFALLGDLLMKFLFKYDHIDILVFEDLNESFLLLENYTMMFSNDDLKFIHKECEKISIDSYDTKKIVEFFKFKTEINILEEFELYALILKGFVDNFVDLLTDVNVQLSETRNEKFYENATLALILKDLPVSFSSIKINFFKTLYNVVCKGEAFNKNLSDLVNELLKEIKRSSEISKRNIEIEEFVKKMREKYQLFFENYEKTLPKNISRRSFFENNEIGLKEIQKIINKNLLKDTKTKNLNRCLDFLFLIRALFQNHKAFFYFINKINFEEDK
ncbi:hypothetical protein HERIO_577 [Hepatospora eriocheir]|uniref:Uncharacterized protein n=1 Tax=Hepatospora eriocheir TaxID=1081669 RepID=A0A1X0QD21_9MICR|nr:hypothetical protein HERIO_577 [Hepatospora eriocheir]